MHLRDPDYGYVRGFHVAAQVLADRVIKTPWDLDVLVFPIIYTYRHHVELTLKRLVRKGARPANARITDQDKKWLRKHRLDKLWEILLPIFSDLVLLPSEAEEGIRG